MLAAIAALTVVTAIGAALVIFASPRASEPKAIRVPAIAAARATACGRHHLGCRGLSAGTSPRPGPVVSPDGRSIARFDRDGRGVLLTQANGSGVEIHRAGSILLIAGIIGMTMMLLLLWTTRPRLDVPKT